ncbi:MAG: formylglycine-generating enzyme family protein [Phycisphaerae bacterium]
MIPLILTASVALALTACGPAPAADTQPATAGAEVTIKGSYVCNGACIPNPKADDHVMVVFAIDGTPEVRAALDRIMAGWPDNGLDADGAQKMLDRFTADLKYYLAPDSPALKDDKSKARSHYCNPAAAMAVTGVLSHKDGKKWITATRIAPAVLKYPPKMLAPDKPFAKADKEPLVLNITGTLTLKCVAIPPGKFMMGTPFYQWPYFLEEYPHVVTLTRPIYMAEVPVTQEMYEAVMGENPSTVKDPQLPVQDPRFADIAKFCRILSEKTGGNIRLPTDAEWEYAGRVGTSNPTFQEKYKDQYSGGAEGFKSPLKVRSKQPNAWGLYDMASCWWEITGDKGMYNVRKSETDPAYPPPAGETGKSQRSGRGIVKEGWSMGTHEFITEKGYAGQKFRIVVDADGPASKTGAAAK